MREQGEVELTSCWPVGGGEMGKLIRAYDWSKTPLGPAETWPQSLRTAVDLVLASQMPMNLLWGPELVQIYNDGFRPFFGTKHPTSLGQPARETWAEVWQASAPITAHVLSGETVTLENYPWTYIRDSGPEESYFTTYYTPVRGQTGVVAGVLATGFETTQRVKAEAERKRVEQALRASEERFRRLANLIPAFVWFIDPDGRVTFANEQWFALTGITDEDSDHWPDLVFHPDERDSNVASWKCRLQEGTAFEIEARIRRYNGDYRWYLTRAVPFRDAEGHINAWFGASTDIHDRKVAGERLRESEARLQAAVDLVGLSLYTWEPETGALQWDARLKALWGLPPDAYVDNEVWLTGLHPQDRARVEAAAAAAIDPAGDGVYDVEYRVIGLQDGVERWVSTHGQTTFEDDRAVSFIGAALDVTQHKRAEEHQKVLLAELQHRVRNMLAVIRSIARQTAETSETVDDYAMHFEGRLNAFARVQAAVARDPTSGVNLASLVAEELLSYTAQEGEQVSLSGPDVCLQPKAAETFGLAVHELATNAIKYGALSSPKGHVTVTWRLEDEDGDQRLRFEWTETGVPVISLAPRRSGFGTELLTQTLPYQLGATTTLIFKPGGLRCTIELSTRSVSQ